MKFGHQKGVSIASLVIIIIIMIILSSAVVITLSSLQENSKRVTFAKELKTIQDKVVEYYSVYGDLPISEDANAKQYTANEYISVVDVGADILYDEITLNNDIAETFYQINLQKIDVKDTSRGAGNKGEDDIYLMTEKTHHVYYLKGYKVSDDRYFSRVNIDIK